MKPETLIALSNLLAKAAKEVELAPGSYHVNEKVSIDVDASISKLEAELYIPTVSIPWKKVVALMLKRWSESSLAMVTASEILNVICSLQMASIIKLTGTCSAAKSKCSFATDRMLVYFILPAMA